MRNVESVLHMVRTYAGASDYLAVFFLCVIFSFYKGDRYRRREIMIISLFSVVLVFNNYMWRFVGRVMESLTYYRFLWMVPIVLLIAYCITDVIDKAKGILEAGFVILLLGCMVLPAGETYLNKASLSLPETTYDVAKDLIQASDIINEDKKEELSMVALEPFMMMNSRVYDPTILWAISYKAHKNLFQNGYYEKTDKFKTEQVLLETVMGSRENESSALQAAIEKKKVDYLMITTSFGMDAYLSEAGCAVIGHTNNYTIYAYGAGSYD